MGRRGPAPTPTALKTLAGNPGKRALNRREPQPRAKRPRPPKHLTATALAEWRRLVRILKPTKLLTEAEADVLAVYCQTYARWVEASEHLEREGMVTLLENGYPVQSAYMSIVNNCIRTMHRLMGELGLTPAARSRLQVDDKERPLTVDDILDAAVHGD